MDPLPGFGFKPIVEMRVVAEGHFAGIATAAQSNHPTAEKSSILRVDNLHIAQELVRTIHCWGDLQRVAFSGRRTAANFRPSRLEPAGDVRVVTKWFVV